MPYTGDHIQKEKEALDLMIKMRKGARGESRSGEMLIFVLIPVVFAVGIMKFKDIKDYAAHNHQLSQLIRMAYPAWEEAPAAPAPVAPVAPEQGDLQATTSSGAAVDSTAPSGDASAGPPAQNQSPVAPAADNSAGSSTNLESPASKP